MTDPDFIALLEPLVKGLKVYHRYAVSGLEHIPTRGKGIVVVNHSLATYDILMLIHSIFDRTGRITRPLVDRWFEHVPIIESMLSRLGCVSGTPDNARHLLEGEQLVLVAPGGMEEAIRPHTQRYQTKWEDRRGFVRLAITTQSPIILAFCPDSDQLYKVYDTKITRMMYRYLRVPMILARGIGPTIVPRPIKLKHFISEPILPPDLPKNKSNLDQNIETLHKIVSQEAEVLMQKAQKITIKNRSSSA